MPKQPAKADKKKNLAIINEATYLLVVLGTIILLLLTTFNLDHYLEKQKVLSSADVTPSSHDETVFWESFLNENENYIEGWFELAKLKMSDGDIAGAREALIKIEEINPNLEELTRLKKLL
ncbi:hypothetical protein KKH23_03135 [Patescibacteria group bacterium]|nr:hypothetical protein [Patescibacteria group bacterium]MBU0776716.1 hypothetical protein [Patescibacteria group bacterium]MBU0846160.1 hypothetical protein [Patescibacteria group bacterium]MBU0922751.1 hypothetical protein [Patescibacteria group bacterium]MBU1066268.1 hypothetical protein [Patescibacteria group bacterium]